MVTHFLIVVNVNYEIFRLIEAWFESSWRRSEKGRYTITSLCYHHAGLPNRCWTNFRYVLIRELMSTKHGSEEGFNPKHELMPQRG